jgi:AraC family transcriptional regulator of arabinose operon
MSRPITPHRDVTTIYTGDFDERAGYATYRPEGTGDWLVILTTGGRGRFGFAGGQIITRTGDIVLLKPRTPHDYGVEDELKHWRLLWAHFQPRPHWMSLLDWPRVDARAPGLLRLELGRTRRFHRIAERLGDAHRARRSALRRNEDLAMHALEDVLLQCDRINPRSDQSRIDERIGAAMDHIVRNHRLPITLESLADIAGLSVSRFSHLFHEQVGTTPQQYLELHRMRQARQLLELTARSVKEVAQAVGYASPFYFCTRFRRHTGQSPRAFRERLASTGPGRP